MAGQTTMNGQQEQSPAANVGKNLAGLADDLVTLVELQCRLTACDVREGAGRSILPICLIAGGFIVALGTIPVVLMGVGWALTGLAGVSLAEALLLVGVGALLLGVAAIGWGVKRMKHALAAFERSRCELLHNIDWIKKVFLQQARQDQNRSRCH